ncbi:hypothetical protein [Massilia sp. 9096]|uniref:glycine-rich domain-containing protein n=1 Tax=Massilia sp. 9096 TaxID=1500894 RepID=UPI000A60DE9A|nr:hypothetical protein [Massilia sp. 9096]
MNANDLLNAVMQLDLEPIKMKLMHISGEGWSLDKAAAVEKEYRRFLCLMKLFPNEDTAPIVDVDTFWHYHILDTMKYAADCEQVFGYFLHHYPYVGMDGSEEDAQYRLSSGKRMQELYESVFGDAYPDSLEAITPSVAGTAYCSSGPGQHANQAAGIAYCSSGPGKHSNPAAAIAYCSSGPGKHSNPAAAIAYCSSGPGKHSNPAAAIAYCSSGPGKHSNPAAAIAYCSSGPGKHLNPAAAIAYCSSGPGKHLNQPVQHTRLALQA